MQEPIYSNAQSNRWVALIDGLQGVQMKLVDFEVPTFSVGSTPLRREGDNMVTIPGDQINFDDLQLNFLVDVNYRNYFYALKWLRSNTKAPEPDVRDVTVMLLDNQGNPQGTQFIFQDCYPTLLGKVHLDQEGQNQDIVMGLTITFNDFEMDIQDETGATLTVE